MSSGRSSEPAGGTEQTGKARAEGRPQGETTDNGMHSNGRGCTTVQKTGYLGARKRNQRRVNRGGNNKFTNFSHNKFSVSWTGLRTPNSDFAQPNTALDFFVSRPVCALLRFCGSHLGLLALSSTWLSPSATSSSG